MLKNINCNLSGYKTNLTVVAAFLGVCQRLELSGSQTLKFFGGLAKQFPICKLLAACPMAICSFL
ncbi:hypothetical protein Nepgr_027614 [Nepenthes gracilis]|uniref:Uncharacterized protein n=1 Tax=Nepenthes gracilis TaxID=150966 RepID=A0AAD3Y3Q5_NEPGR|nr:hypothetical protein Nepgr_027614 [Nepenthes gracilis]